MGPDGRILPALKTNQIAGFVKNTARSRIEKKKKCTNYRTFLLYDSKNYYSPQCRWVITKLMKVEMIKYSAKLYKDSDFHQPNKMTMKKKKANSFHLIFSNHFASCFNLIKLLGGEFPHIISSFSILRKVF